MTTERRDHAEDLRGAGRLAVEATRGITDLVESMHLAIAGGPAALGRPLSGPARLFTGLTYRIIRGVTSLVGAGVDLALARLVARLGESTPGPERDALLSVLNGVIGDHLRATKNPLAIEMRLRCAGRDLTLERTALSAQLPRAGGKLLVLVHGCCLSDRGWNRLGHDHGAALERDLGYLPLYLRYNSGLHVSENGRALAALLEELAAEWPVPVEEVAILAHSMGGLVARSACHYGELSGHRWRSLLRRVVFLGTPHQGAPLERGGGWVDTLLGVSRYSAPFARLGRIRSAGVTDLRYGNVLDEHWSASDRHAPPRDARERIDLPAGVACYAIAGTTAPRQRRRIPGDGLVPVDSALGRHRRRELTLCFPEAHQWIAFGAGHLDLLDRDPVYQTIRRWISS
jgi:hypothetical protein